MVMFTPSQSLEDWENERWSLDGTFDPFWKGGNSCWKATFKSSRDSSRVCKSQTCCNGWEESHGSTGGNKYLLKHPNASQTCSRDIHEGSEATITMANQTLVVTSAHRSPCSTQRVLQPAPQRGAVPPCPALPCPAPAQPGPVLLWWASSCGCGLRSWDSPSYHPTEISKLKRPKGDINSWHPNLGGLT